MPVAYGEPFLEKTPGVENRASRSGSDGRVCVDSWVHPLAARVGELATENSGTEVIA